LIKRRFGDPWYISMGLFYLSEQKPVEGEAADGEYNSAFMRKEAALAELRLWYSSFYSTIKKGTVPETVGSLICGCASKVAVMTLETTLHTKFTDTPEMWDIVDLTRKILIGLKSRSTPKFALDVGVVIPLYLMVSSIPLFLIDVRRQN
jgi:hypothetical protein